VSVIAEEFQVDAPCALSVTVPGARTRLRPGARDDRVQVEISVTGCPPEEAEDILDRLQVSTQQTKGTVHVYSEAAPDRSDAEWWRWIRSLDVAVHVDLRLPSRIEAELRVPGGDIDLADLQGEVDVNVMGGTCRVENMSGSLDVRAESSDVTIQGFSGDELLARVAVGSLTVDDADADTITARSVAAPMTLSDVRGPTTITAKSAPVELHDVGGPCTARVQGGTLTYGGTPKDEIELRVVGGSLDVALPPDHGADLAMLGPSLSLADAFAFEGEQTDQAIEGSLNGGGPSLLLRATGGGTIHCRPA
jgi:hypothetical protein